MAMRVSKPLYNEIEQVKKIAQERNVNILDTDAITELAAELDLKTLQLAIKGNPRRYLACIEKGMNVEDVDLA